MYSFLGSELSTINADCDGKTSSILNDAKIFSKIDAALIIASDGSTLPFVEISKIKLSIVENDLFCDWLNSEAGRIFL